MSNVGTKRKRETEDGDQPPKKKAKVDDNQKEESEDEKYECNDCEETGKFCKDCDKGNVKKCEFCDKIMCKKCWFECFRCEKIHCKDCAGEYGECFVCGYFECEECTEYSEMRYTTNNETEVCISCSDDIINEVAKIKKRMPFYSVSSAFVDLSEILENK